MANKFFWVNIVYIIMYSKPNLLKRNKIKIVF